MVHTSFVVEERLRTVRIDAHDAQENKGMLKKALSGVLLQITTPYEVSNVERFLHGLDERILGDDCRPKGLWKCLKVVAEQ